MTSSWPCRGERILLIFLALLPTLSLIAPLALAPALLLLAVLGLLPWLWRRRHAPPVRQLVRDPLLWLAVLLTAWGLTTLAWSLQPLQGATLVPRVALILVAGIVLSRLLSLEPAWRALARRAIVFGGLVAIGWLIADTAVFDYAISGALTGHDPGMAVNVPKRGVTVLALLVWPMAYIVARGRTGVGGGLFIIVLLGMAVDGTEAGAAKLAMACGAGTFLVAWLAPRLAAGAAAAIVTLGVLAAPAVVPVAIERFHLLEAADGSSRHRLVIWNFAADRIHEKPLGGWGFNMARSIPGGKDIDPLTRGEYMPLHPHNAPLQWWLEMGLPGAAIGVATIIVLLRRAASDPTRRGARAMAMATFASALTVSVVGYGAWQLWWLSALVLIGGAVVAAQMGAERGDNVQLVNAD